MSFPSDVLPPPVIQETRRNWTGWVALSLLVGFTLLMALAESLTVKPPSQQVHDDQQEVLQSFMQAESRQGSATNQALDVAKKDVATKKGKVSSALAELSRQPSSDHMAAKLTAAMRTELHQPVQATLLGPLLKSKAPVDHLFAEIYGSPKLSLSKANQLVALLPKWPFVYTAAKVHALEKAGDKGALARFVPPKNTTSILLAGWLSVACLAISFSIWSQIWARHKQGTLLPRGIPMDTITALDADRLAIRGAQIFALYLIASTFASYLPRDYFGLPAKVVVIVFLLVTGVVLLQRLEVDGKRITLDMIGVSSRDLGQNVILGIQCFFAEFPVALILAGIGSAIFSFLPRATHPATEALSRDHSLATIVPVIVLGSILAPFWEEIVFRGLLFPALKRLMGGMVPGILVSSFLFASLHPQGISIWLALAGVGAASCLVSYQSRSLVPSMVMHCMHNTAVFALTLLVQ